MAEPGGTPEAAAPVQHSLRRNVGVTTLATVTRGLLAFATSVVVARALTTEDRGTYSLVTTSVTLLVMLAALGVPAALTRERAAGAATVRELYQASLLLGLGCGVVASAGFGAVYLLASDQLFDGIRVGEAITVMALVPPVLVLSHWTVVTYLEDRVLRISAVSATAGVVLLVSAALLAAADRLTATTVLACWALSSVLPLVLLARWSSLRGALSSRRTALAVLRFGIRSNVATVALILAWRVDIYFVKAYRDLAELGLYAVAVTLAEIMLAVATSARVALTPRQGQHTERDQLVLSISGLSRLTVTGGAVAALVLALIAHPLVLLLYGERYAGAAAALIWLAPGIVALVAQGPLIDYLLVEGAVRQVSCAAAAALVLNIALNMVLLPRFDFTAAAAAAAAAYAVSFGWCLVLFCRRTGTRPRDVVLAGPSDVRMVLGRVASPSRSS